MRKQHRLQQLGVGALLLVMVLGSMNIDPVSNGELHTITYDSEKDNEVFIQRPKQSAAVTPPVIINSSATLSTYNTTYNLGSSGSYSYNGGTQTHTFIDITINSNGGNYGFVIDNSTGAISGKIVLNNIEVLAINNTPADPFNIFRSNYTHAGIKVINANSVQLLNCKVRTQSYYGIIINGSSNTLVDSCEISHCTNFGIYAINSASTTISYNNIHDNLFRGIGVDTCTTTNIQFNNVYNSTFEGIHANSMTGINNFIDNNTVSRNSIGILVKYADNLVVRNNYCTLNIVGIKATDGTRFLNVSANTATNNYDSGIVVGSHLDIQASHNTVTFNGGDGLTIENTRVPASAFTTFSGTTPDPSNQVRFPSGIAVYSGNVYIVDTGNNRILQYTTGGSPVRQWGTYGKATSSGSNIYFDRPHGITVNGSGIVYVADTYNNRIQQFSQTGTYLSTFGSVGNEAGQFYLPYGIAAIPNGQILVADTYNQRIQHFTFSGGYIRSYTLNGELVYPVGIAASATYIFVSDIFTNLIHRIEISNPTNYITFGGAGTSPGLFNRPTSIAIDGSFIRIVDSGNNRVQRFTTLGQYSSVLGASFDNPYGVAMDGTSIVVSDSNNALVQGDNVIVSGGHLSLPNPNGYTINQIPSVVYRNQPGYSGYPLTETTGNINPDTFKRINTGNPGLRINWGRPTALTIEPFDRSVDVLDVSYTFVSYARVYSNIAHDNGHSGISVLNSNSTRVYSNNIQRNGYAGISIANGGNNTVASNTIIDNYGHGVVFQNEENSIINSANSITTNQGDGIQIINSPNAYIHNNNVNNNDGNGLSIESNLVQVNSGQFNLNGLNGIKITGDYNIVRGAAQIGRNTENGVYCVGLSNSIYETTNLSANILSGAVIIGNNNAINNSVIRNNGRDGIELSGNDVKIYMNTIENNFETAIYLNQGTNALLSTNTMVGTGIFFADDTLDNLLSHTMTGNTLGGIQTLLLKQNNTNIAGTWGQIIAIASSSTIASKSFTSGSAAIALYYCTNVALTSLTISNQRVAGIYLYQSTGTTINGLTMSGNDYGILGQADSISTLGTITISNSVYTGVKIQGNSNSFDCDINTAGADGIWLHGNNNLIASSMIQNCQNFGVWVSGTNVNITSMDFSNNGNGSIKAENIINGRFVSNEILGTSQLAGLWILNSNNIVVQSNNITNYANDGILLSESTNLQLDLNRVIGYGLRITGTINDHFSSHTITANTRNGSAITYYKNVENTPILSSSSQIILVNTNQTTGSNLIIDGASIAIQLYNSHNNKFSSISITNSRYNGINGISSSGNEFLNAFISDTLLGANLHFEQSNSLLFSFVTSSDSIIGLLAINCNSLKIQFSNILSNINGIDIYASSTIEVSYTTIDDNFIGISLTDCYYPTIQASNLQNFGVIGILLDNCVLPYLFDNEFTESSGTPLYLSNTDSGTISLQSFSSLTTPGAKIIMDAESSNNYLDRITISNINTGIEVWGNNNILQTSVISGASTAIEIYGSNNELNSLSITSSTTGILVQANSFNTKILGSTFSDLTTAIHIQSDADLVYIEYNQIEQSDVGIRVDVASNVEIRYTLYCTNIANTQISPLATNIVQFQNWNCFSGSDAAEDSLKDTTDPRNNEPGIKALDEIPGYSTSLLIILGLISIFGLIIKRRS